MLGIEKLEPWTQPFLDEVNLRLHLALVEMLDSSGESIREIALQNVRKWLAGNQYTDGALRELKDWEKALERSSNTELSELMLDRTEEGVLRRSNSPFAGILSERERMRIVEDLENEIDALATPA